MIGREMHDNDIGQPKVGSDCKKKALRADMPPAEVANLPFSLATPQASAIAFLTASMSLLSVRANWCRRRMPERRGSSSQESRLPRLALRRRPRNRMVSWRTTELGEVLSMHRPWQPENVRASVSPSYKEMRRPGGNLPARCWIDSAAFFRRLSPPVRDAR